MNSDDSDKPLPPTESVPESDAASGFSVVVFARPDDPDDLTDVLIDAGTATNETDAHIITRHAPGLLDLKLDQVAAVQLAEKISEIGIQAKAVARSLVPRMDQHSVAHHVRCTPEGFTIVGFRESTSETLPWASLRLVSIGMVPLERSRYYAEQPMTSMHVAPITPAGSIEATSIRGPEAWLIFSPPTRAVRIDHHLLNYEYLAERKLSSATANFRLFAEDLKQFASAARHTPATHAYLHREPAHRYDFSDPQKLEEATVLHWLMIADSVSSDGA